VTQKITKPSNKSLEDLLPKMSPDLSKKLYISNNNNVEISVWSEFIDSQVSAIGSLFVWIYHIKITNKSLEPLRLINRHWKIIDEKGSIQEVDGEGVIGEKPLISPNNNFQYSSGVHLRHPSGIMTGYYQMQKDNGEVIQVKIPTFSLDIPSLKGRIN
jgi:ApaG protein